MGGEIVLYDPRFSAIRLPGLTEERDRLNESNTRIIELENEINLLKSQLNIFEFLKDRVMIKCPVHMKKITFINCKAHRERNDNGCNCAARQIWLRRYIL